jgi:hypothetical protein
LFQSRTNGCLSAFKRGPRIGMQMPCNAGGRAYVLRLDAQGSELEILGGSLAFGGLAFSLTVPRCRLYVRGMNALIFATSRCVEFRCSFSRQLYIG